MSEYAIAERMGTFFRYTGEVAFFFAETVRHCFGRYSKSNLRNLVAQMYFIGFLSIPLIVSTSMFTGMALTIQSAAVLEKFGSKLVVGNVVSQVMTREFGPIMCALMIAGRVGASMAAELGSMKVTEQIDALFTLAANPIKYLVVPRFLGSLVMVPILTLFSIFFGVFGGYLAGVYLLNVPGPIFISEALNFLDPIDIVSSSVKAMVFGGIVSIIGCYQGFITRGGAEGVGHSATITVVISSVLILLSDLLMTVIIHYIIT
ncbi:MAG: MlaE family ABC transporter permease [bacterium]